MVFRKLFGRFAPRLVLQGRARSATKVQLWDFSELSTDWVALFLETSRSDTPGDTPKIPAILGPKDPCVWQVRISA
jgi:hypothetical protein